MRPPSFIDHCSNIIAEAGRLSPVGELASLLSSGMLHRRTLDEIVDRHGVERETWFRKQVLDFALGYVAALLKRGPVDKNDEIVLADLKTRLDISEGEFFSLRPAEVATILAGEVKRILADDEINASEDLYLVSLQSVFDLSYDQYLQLTRAEFERGMASLSERAANARNSGDEALAREFRRRITVLEPVYQLAISQPRRLGALY